MAASVEDVLDIPELLEMIILELPPHDILLAQRTSKTWNAAIAKSLRIQRKLFKASGGPPLAPSSNSSVQHSVYDSQYYEHELSFNPLLPSICRAEGPLVGIDGVQSIQWRFTGRELLDRIVHMPEEMKIDYERKAWNGMFVTQPPCTTAMVWSSGNYKTQSAGCSLRVRTGIQLKHIFDVAIEMARLSAEIEKPLRLGIRLLMPIRNETEGDWMAAAKRKMQGLSSKRSG